ncbi:bacterial Ig-like domain-containing protein [Enterococcus faecalis]|uniref:bacterial Ig-like domain-containing protein n=1 Tax=Enterococcus faecalis TaxID=1351 RepID=UPI00026D756A|nr:bacterial Ig-like domain-containing protein [Enterococcus faecalis]AFO43329.1 hypothetical protein EFD32_0439 [Enterococcus faecalis D32]
MNKKKFRSVVATASLLSSTLLLSVAPILSMPTASADGVVAINEWETTVNGDTTVLTNYIGQAKDVVIPLSGDLGTTNVKITKTALRAAATSADNQGGTLANSANDTAGTSLVADNSTDDNPSDTTVDYSGTFKDLTKITKIDLSQLKIEAHDGAKGQNVIGANGATARGEDGQAGESIDVSSMFENCTALKEVDLSSFVGWSGNGGDGGDGTGGNGGYAGNFNAQNMFENTPTLIGIQLSSFVGQNGEGGNGGKGHGYGGDGYGGNGYSAPGQVDENFLIENLLKDPNIFVLYQAYTGTTDKTNMFSPIAVNELALTKKVGFALDELKENVGALRTTDSGKGENIRDSELGNVSLSAKDETGNAVDLANVSNKAGEYTLTYTYNGKSIDTHLTVEGGSITTQDLTLGTGDAWKPEDNFVSAINENKQPIPFDQLTVTGADQVNLSKAGTYTVSFSYQDVSKTLTADAKVNVIDIQTKSLVLDVGDPWQPYAALVSVTNVDQVEHTAQVYFEQNVTASAIDKGSGVAVDIAQLTANPGTYTVTYTYAGISRSVDVLVEKIELANQSVLPSDIDFGTPPIQYEKDQLLDGQTNGKPTEGKIEVKDTRSKTGEGYKVKVSQTQPFTGKNTKAELNATLSFKTGTLTNSENLPIAGSNQTIQLLPGQETIVLATTQGQSRGTTTLPLHTFQLVVPKEAEKRKDVYETTLTWTLSDTP